MLARIRQNLATGLCWVQGSYYFATAIWPIIHVRSFKWVTGEKTDNLPSGDESDHWLLMTVSALILAIAIALLIAAWRRTAGYEIAALAICAAAGLTTIDVVYTVRGIISPIYLLDAAIEVPLALLWVSVLTAIKPKDRLEADCGQ